ncbi:MAG: S8 family serine peptidase [Anaerolineae bacterium]
MRLILILAIMCAVLPGASLAQPAAAPPQVQPDDAPPLPETEITTSVAEEFGKRLSPTLRELAEEGGEEVTSASVWVRKGTDISPYVELAAQGRFFGNVTDPADESGEVIPAEELGFYAVQVKAGNLYKLASIEGVVLVSYATEEALPPRYEDPDQESTQTDYAAIGDRMRELRDNPPAAAAQEEATIQGWFDVGPGHESRDAWDKGYTGAGVRVAVVDTGTDMAHPDLMGTQARQPHVGNAAYWDWPISFDPFSQLLLAYETIGGPDYISEWGWNSAFANTGWTSSGTALTLQQPMSDGSTFAGTYTHAGITSQSGTYHIGLHPDWSLQAIWGEPVAVLVVDEITAGVYDAVYVDVNNNHEFGDDKACRKGDEVAYWDADLDGYADLSGGMIYWISDGVNQIPGQYWGPLARKAAGAMVLFHINDPLRAGQDHGTLCASNVTGQGRTEGDAPSWLPEEVGGLVWGAGKDAELVTIGNIYYDHENSTLAAWLFGALGYDWTANTGDEIQIMSNSYGDSDVNNDDWDYRSRLVSDMNLQGDYQPSPVYLFSTGNGGPGYGTNAPPTGLTAISVGASTQSGSTGTTDSITSADQIVWGDMIGWSNRGPTASGHLAPHVSADGAFGAGALPLNEVGDGWRAWENWGGTSRSTPVAAANLTLVYQAYKDAHGRFPTYSEVRQILMASATDRYHDTWVQGAGTVNADRATDLAAGLNGVYLTPDSLSFGDYRGTRYEAFAEIMYPGTSSAAVFTVTNPTASEVTVDLAGTHMTRMGEYTMEITATRSSESPYNANRPDYLFDVDAFTGGQGIPTEADLMTVELLQTRDQMDSDDDYQYDDMWRVLVYDWTDVNSDGGLWDDANQNGTVSGDEIDAGEYIRYGLGYNAHVYKTVSVHKPLDRMHNGIFVGLQHRTRGDQSCSNLQVRVSFWKRADWPWLSLSDASVTVPAEGSASFSATMDVPAEADLGAYEGGILVTVPATGTYAAYTFIAPMMVNVAGQDPTTNAIVLGGTGDRADTPYDNGYIQGAQDWSWRAESGDWRFYMVDQTTEPPAGTRLFVRTQWDDQAPFTDLDTLVLGPAADDFSGTDPSLYGPHTLAQVAGSENTNLGAGVWGFQTTTGINDEIVVSPLTEGLHEIIQHSVDFNGNAFEVPFTTTVGTLQTAESLEVSSCCLDEPVTFTSTVDIPEGLDVWAYGLTVITTTLQDQKVLQDDPDAACTSSWTRQLHVVDEGSLKIELTPQASDDLDLYVLYNPSVEPTCPDEIVASSTNAAGQSDRVEIKWPADGYYAIYVHGWDVPAGESTFQIEITEEVLNDMLTVYDAPSGPIIAGTPVQFHVSSEPMCETAPSASGTYRGRVGIGVTDMAYLLEIPVTYTCDRPTIEAATQVDKVTAFAGQELTYTVTISNTGCADATAASMTDLIPNHTTYVTGSVTGGAVYSATLNAVTWQGALAVSAQRTFTFRVLVDEETPDETEVASVVETDNGYGLTGESNTVRTLVQVDYLIDSEMTVTPILADQGDVVTYTVTIRNTGGETVTVAAYDPLPSDLEYVPDSLTKLSGPGAVSFVTNTVLYEGPLGFTSLNEASFRFQARITDSAVDGQMITNVTYLDDGLGFVIQKEATVAVAWNAYMPTILKTWPPD